MRLRVMNATAPTEGDCRGGVRQIVATGFNYKKHIEEFKMKPPTEPEVFLKAISSLTGPFDPVFRCPNHGVKLDWEVELAIVAGREARDISAAEATDYIFGYVCVNDISDRTTQVDAEGQQHLVRAKSRWAMCWNVASPISEPSGTRSAAETAREPRRCRDLCSAASVGISIDFE
jgi:2-keto-4-pentenoate hydratase/2-oxohepta-3-ene-1,7-dioic acid hydratase in catechol pathway